MEYGLQLNNGGIITPGSLRTNWTPASPMSEEDVWAIITTKRRAGMPLAASLREAGYDPDQITAIQLEQDRELARAERMYDAEAVMEELRAAEARERESVA